MALKFKRSDYLHMSLAAIAFICIYPAGPYIGGLLSGSTLGAAREVRDAKKSLVVPTVWQTLRDIAPYSLGGLVVGVVIHLVELVF